MVFSMSANARFTIIVLLALLLAGCNGKRKDLLCDTDYDAILQASRQILAETRAGRLKPGWYEFKRHPRSPEISQFPKVIRDLSPTRIIIEYEGSLMIQFGGGPDSFGLRAYPENFSGTLPNSGNGARRLIEGLWYCDQDYRDIHAAYKRKIDAWIEGNLNRK